MKLATPILKIPHPEHQYKFPKVEEAWHYYCPGKPYKEQHHALNDSMHEAFIIYRMYQKKHWILEI